MTVLPIKSKTLCVADASTYVGLWIVKGLLLRGYDVHAATFQRGEESESVRKLIELGLTNEGLRIFAADVLDYQSITEALRGCSGLFYASDQSTQNGSEYDERMIEIEIRGSHNVLEACAHSETVEKVVFTSSVCAMIWREDRISAADNILDERSWSDANYCSKIKLWYALAKTLSEKTAWALAMDRGLNMVTINSALIEGPDFSHQNSGSSSSYLKGAAQMFADGVLASVDVRFLADVHISVMEDPAAFGRYICFNHIINTAERAVNLARSLSPMQVTLPDSWEDSRACRQRLSNKKLEKLMMGAECRTMQSKSQV